MEELPTVNTNKRKSERIQKQVEEYLKQGGKIEKVDASGGLKRYHPFRTNISDRNDEISQEEKKKRSQTNKGWIND